MIGNLTEYSVSELSFALKRTLEEAYGLVRVRGELSGCKKAGSGHLYFCLKDDRAVLDAVAWKGALPRLAFVPADGLEVICTGRLTTYPGRSKYQISVEKMEPAGVGALMALLEERKRRLDAEGLFAASRKQPIPLLPGVVGVVTSPTGAVIRDILHRLAERFPRRVLLWPVAVQGEGAAEQIAAAISGFGKLPIAGPVPRPDVLIIARGGGSIEDLWAFNEEVVLRAAAACPIPLISAVGHETDTTLIDFVADRRAPTPTAAAEMVVPVRSDLALRVEQAGLRKDAALRRSLRERAGQLDGLRRGLPEPRQLLRMATQRLDDLSERLRLRTPLAVLSAQCEMLERCFARVTELCRDRLVRAEHEARSIGSRLSSAPIAAAIANGNRALHRDTGRLEGAVTRQLGECSARLARTRGLLDSLGPHKVLERGYAIVRAPSSGEVLTTAARASLQSTMVVTFRDGDLQVANPANRSARRRSGEDRAEPVVAQGSLL
jgi:exodeoxyribonuclease VII large subunit